MSNATIVAIITMAVAKSSWSRVHIDFLGSFMEYMFSLLIDIHSKWMKVYPMASVTAKVITECLRNVLLNWDSLKS